MSCNTKPVDPEDLDLDYNREPVCPHCGAEKRDAATLGVCNGWERATEAVELAEDIVESGDWYMRDSNGTIRLAYGWLGGSVIRCHIYDVTGQFSHGWEVRGSGVDDTPGAKGYYEAVRIDLMAKSIEYTGWPEAT